uniref:Uncharacterized protein n=1 Tax=Peronospora matthiolae TaxID=2874970 RepID=A0AAV1TG42_9STRA
MGEFETCKPDRAEYVSQSPPGPPLFDTWLGDALWEGPVVVHNAPHSKHNRRMGEELPLQY